MTWFTAELSDKRYVSKSLGNYVGRKTNCVKQTAAKSVWITEKSTVKNEQAINTHCFLVICLSIIGIID